jgi:lysozyme
MSLCFNIGADNFRQSTVLKKLNTGDYRGAADAFMMWSKPEVLRQRRIKERALFLSPFEGEKT